MSAVPQALADVKVLEFGGYAAGPHIGKVLANYGARTIHVESRERPALRHAPGEPGAFAPPRRRAGGPG